MVVRAGQAPAAGKVAENQGGGPQGHQPRIRPGEPGAKG